MGLCGDARQGRGLSRRAYLDTKQHDSRIYGISQPWVSELELDTPLKLLTQSGTLDLLLSQPISRVVLYLFKRIISLQQTNLVIII